MEPTIEKKGKKGRKLKINFMELRSLEITNMDVATYLVQLHML